MPSCGAGGVMEGLVLVGVLTASMGCRGKVAVFA